MNNEVKDYIVIDNNKAPVFAGSHEECDTFCDENVSGSTNFFIVENKIKKHIFAEKYRGLYSSEIDILIDKINKLVQERYELNQEMNSKLENKIEDLKKYYALTNNIDDLFKEIQEKSDKI